MGVDTHGLNQSGFCSYDLGLANTTGHQPAISRIDTENSVLLHRGYSVDQLARQCDLFEVAYIMLNGDAPDEASYQTFHETVTRHTLVHEQIARVCSGFRCDSYPMALMCALVGALAAFYHDVLDVENPQHRALVATRLLLKMSTIAVTSYKYTIGQPAAYPRSDLPYVGNFLQVLFAIPAEKYVLNPAIERAMNQTLVPHADHGQCASITTVRAAGSSRADLFACVAAGLASLWGSVHGGANESSIRMLEETESVDQVLAFLRQAKHNPQALRRLGFDNSRHRHRDPCAGILRETSHRVLAEVGMSDRLLQAAIALEDVALTDPYFVDNDLSPGVDFYTAVIPKAMNLPLLMLAVVTAVGWTIGWVTHWNEMYQAPLTIYRPRQVYAGEGYRNYVLRRGEQSVDLK